MPRSHGTDPLKRPSRTAASALVALLGLAAPNALGQVAPAAPAPPTPARAEYRIGFGDELSIYVFGEEREHEVVVRPDGRITLPLVGDIEAEGMPPTLLAKSIASKLEPFQKDPVVTVAVRQIRSYRLFMLGKVGTQGMIESPTPLRLLQAVAMAGGLNEFSNEKLVVLRDTSEGQKRIPIDYGAILKGKAPDQNILLMSGDVVWAE
ncbi:MAG: polysaccharide export protein [Acidobacteria bacterium]|nr:polysaccharide export protein [Acidobacteriota bacterium]